MMKYLLLCTGLLSTGLQASDCEYDKSIELTLDLAGSTELAVLAAAGDLEITGIEDSRSASIKGRVCVSKKEWLEQSRVETSGGKRAEIRVVLPDTSGWSFGSSYAYLDLELEVPGDIALVVRDSSGDIEIGDAGAVDVKDSSGDIEIRRASGPVNIQDSSGDIELADIDGDITIESDSSGGIRGKKVGGTVRVENDSSGDIRFSEVAEDFIVERDSSGDITADTIGGDFRVLRDGSGDISAINVSGEVVTPEN